MSIEAEIGLEKNIINEMGKIFFEMHDVSEVVIFGSRAKRINHEGSDIDLVVKGKDVNLDTILNLMRKIDSLGLLYKIDIQNYNSIINPDLINHIDRVGKILWRRNH